MGGEGSMATAINTLRQNRALLKKRKLRTKADVYGKKGLTKLDLKQSTAHDMKIIRQKIRGYQRENRAILFVSLVAVLFLFFAMIWLFFPSWIGID